MPEQGSRCAASTTFPPSIGSTRTINPIESTFATVRHRTIRSRDCLSNRTALAMVFKLVEAAQKNGDASTATTSCQNSILGVKFTDGLEVVAKPANRQLATAAA